MENLILHNGHIRIYKRKDSDYWQMKIKAPRKKAIRESTGCKLIDEAKIVAFKKYNLLNSENRFVSKLNNQIHNFQKTNLLGIKNMSKTNIEYILKYSQQFIDLNNQIIKKNDMLFGKTIINIFFENSTRTRTSFEIAAKRLSADIINISPGISSINKGETFYDTIITLNSMNPDLIVIRHSESFINEYLSNKLNCCIINAGDGTNEHPTQALLDALTIKNTFGSFKNLKIAICGDILHSRVAKSNIFLLKKMGVKINVIGPKFLIPKYLSKLGVSIHYDMKSGLKDCDIIMMLRIQKERILNIQIPSEKDYFNKYGLDIYKLKFAKKDALIMHPGPINRGVEIDNDIADDLNRSLILKQVNMGVALRMACLKILIDNKDR